jgi:hypothetical protein
MITDKLRAKITADVAAESAGNVAYWNANRAVVEAAREVQIAWDAWNCEPEKPLEDGARK